VELDGSDHFFWTENGDAIADEVEEFLTGARHGPEPTRKLATVLFSDIVGSTERASELGDRGWPSLLERHDSMIRRALVRFSGREVKSTGDGFLAVFDGPTAAIRCAEAIRGGASGLGCELRVGVHTGEIELMGDDIGGIGVHIARRVADSSGPGEIWVSGTVPGVVVGSGIEFRERGAHALKGVPGDWALFSVEAV
jgi:class 3 adenylate cyclase